MMNKPRVIGSAGNTLSDDWVPKSSNNFQARKYRVCVFFDSEAYKAVLSPATRSGEELLWEPCPGTGVKLGTDGRNPEI